jgi:ADP-ribosylation factor-binding protein GGA
LQISTKDFLNELVRRFPERPPIRNTRVQNKILELVEEWRRTICETSKYREDLGFVRDMHRLLHLKGYQFPAVRREDAAVLNPSDNLKSAEEMESEEREAQSAKLQELIRRGTPHDLQEANKLMKVMAGYDTRKKTDYRAKAAEEVGKIQQKARLLEEMLQGYKPGDEIKEGDVFEELANALASAHPKIQKMCEEESDDTEAVAKLFEINDSIHRTIERYKLIKKGDIEAANAIPKGTLGTSGAGVRKGPDNELSLIDFDGPEQSAPQQQQQQQQDQSAPAPPPKAGNALEDDLLGLNMGDGNFGEGGGISLGSSSNGASKAPSMGNADIMAQFSQPQQQRSTPQPSMPSMFSQPAPPPQSASTDLFGSLSGPSSHSVTPSPQHQQHQQPPQKKPDPFAALSNSNSRSGSPFQFQSRAPPPAPAAAPASSNFDLLGGAAPTSSAPVPVADDDEWAFSSALPDQPQDLVVTNSAIKTVFAVTRPNNTELIVSSRISNSTVQTIEDLTFQLAVTKVRLPFQPTPKTNPSQLPSQSLRTKLTNPTGLHPQTRAPIRPQSIPKPAKRHHTSHPCAGRGARTGQSGENEVESELFACWEGCE